MKNLKIRYKELDGKTGLPLRIVADAGVSRRGFCGGRLIPLVILDTSERPDVEEFVRLHHVTESPGDVRFNWGQIENTEETVILWLEFARPAELSFAIDFRIVGQSILVEHALFGKGIYIQPGREGDRFKDDINRPKVFVELRDAGFQEAWEEIFLKQYSRIFRGKGLGRFDARRAATRMLNEMREVFHFRMRDL